MLIVCPDLSSECKAKGYIVPALGTVANVGSTTTTAAASVLPKTVTTTQRASQTNSLVLDGAKTSTTQAANASASSGASVSAGSKSVGSLAWVTVVVAGGVAAGLLAL